MGKNAITSWSLRGWNRVRKCTAGRLALRFLVEETGPSATEYAMLLALLILGALATIGNIGSSMETIYTMIATEVDAAFGG